MATAYKCDQCGKYFDKIQMEVASIEKTYLKHTIYLTVTSYSAQGKLDTYKKDQLCPECQHKFALELIKQFTSE